MQIHFTYENENGEEVTVGIPAKYEVCSGCEGHGKHVDPAVDGNGISQEQFDEDPDFEEAYFAGRYDVTCETCNGNRVEMVPDWEAMKKDIRELYEKHLDDEASYQRTCAYERRYGC